MKIINKLLIVGYGRHGKDEAGKYLGSITRLRYAGSTSWAALPLMAAYLNQHPQQAWENRANNRDVWKDHLDECRRFNPARLADMALESGDIVTGVRDKKELVAIKERCVVDHILWIHRPGTPLDSTVTFGAEDCDEVFVNGGDLDTFHRNLHEWASVHSLLR